jgi:hypothetical protein
VDLGYAVASFDSELFVRHAEPRSAPPSPVRARGRGDRQCSAVAAAHSVRAARVDGRTRVRRRRSGEAARGVHRDGRPRESCARRSPQPTTTKPRFTHAKCSLPPQCKKSRLMLLLRNKHQTAKDCRWHIRHYFKIVDSSARRRCQCCIAWRPRCGRGAMRSPACGASPSPTRSPKDCTTRWRSSAVARTLPEHPELPVASQSALRIDLPAFGEGPEPSQSRQAAAEEPTAR